MTIYQEQKQMAVDALKEAFEIAEGAGIKVRSFSRAMVEYPNQFVTFHMMKTAFELTRDAYKKKESK